jgi:purine-binding chemotaxis protein CheW
MSLGGNIPDQLVTFRAGDYLLGVNVLQVQEVLRYQLMTTVPKASREVLGLLNLRGHIVTAIGMRERLNLEQAKDEHDLMNLIVTLKDCAASLVVDSVGDVISLDPKRYKPRPSTLLAPLSELVAGVYQMEAASGDRLLLHIDPEEVCALDLNGEVSDEQ